MQNKLFSKCTLYLSHPVRGSNNDFEGNCKKAHKAAKKIMSVFPEINIYCPGSHDIVIQILYNKGKICLNDILEADLEILRKCDGWAWYKFDESEGSTIEMDRAIELGFCNEHNCIFTFDIEKANYNYLRKTFAPLVESAKRRFRKKNNEAI